MLGNKGLIASVIFTTLTIMTLGLDTAIEVKIFAMFSVAIGIGVIFYNVINMKKNKEKNIDDPLSILKKRYAGGEITKEEFDKMKQDLG